MDAADAFARAWRLAYGPPPEDYTVFDIESTGFSVESDFVTEIGWLVVVGGRERSRASVALDWTRVLDGPRLRVLADRLAATAAQMRRRGKAQVWTVDRMAAEGVAPREAFGRFAGLLGRRPVLVGHRPWHFDVPMLDRLGADLTGLPLGLPDNQVIDTAAMVKAIQSGAFPRAGEAYRAFAVRANAAGGNRYRSNLDEFCFARFKLGPRYGADAAQAHAAAYDCYLTHLVYRDLRHVIVHGRLPDDLAALAP